MQRIHIFRAGTQTASDGTVINYTAADLAATASSYNPAVHEAPIVVGHPELTAPAFGWVKRLVAQGMDLFAETHQVNAEFAELVKSGAYKKVSASFYPPEHPRNPVPGVYTLNHVGFLGAQPPAVKGLQAIEFADGAACVAHELDFAEDAAPADAPAASAMHATTSVSSTSATPPATPPTPETPTVTPEEARALQERATKLEADLAAAHATLLAQAAAANTASHKAFAETLVAQGRITAADVPLVVATLDHLEPPTVPGSSVQLVQFGEGDGKQPLGTALQTMLKSLPPRVDFSEQASRDRAAAGAQDPAGAVQYAEGTPPETIELDKRIRAFAAEHKLGYAEAAQNVAMQDARARR